VTEYHSSIAEDFDGDLVFLRSIAIQSERVDRRSRLALTCPAS